MESKHALRFWIVCSFHLKKLMKKYQTLFNVSYIIFRCTLCTLIYTPSFEFLFSFSLLSQICPSKYPLSSLAHWNHLLSLFPTPKIKIVNPKWLSGMWVPPYTTTCSSVCRFSLSYVPCRWLCAVLSPLFWSSMFMFHTCCCYCISPSLTRVFFPPHAPLLVFVMRGRGASFHGEDIGGSMGYNCTLML